MKLTRAELRRIISDSCLFENVSLKDEDPKGMTPFDKLLYDLGQMVEEAPRFDPQYDDDPVPMTVVIGMMIRELEKIKAEYAAREMAK